MKIKDDKYSTDGAARAVKEVVGMPFDQAVALIDELKAEFRLSHVDGKARILTRDYVRSRVNLDIVDGIVTSAHIG